MSAIDFNEKVAELAREKRRMDRIGGLLVVVQERHRQLAADLDRAIYEACRAPAAGPVAEPLPLGTKLKFGRALEVVALPAPAIAQSHATIDGRRTIRCGLCQRPGHNRYHCERRRSKGTP